jgi:hypothetical protein
MTDIEPKKPQPRAGVYELYWKFAYERQRIFEKRMAGHTQPWTTDEILSRYKFCNTYRAADRVSQYMIRDVCYNSEPSTSEDRIFQITAFRFFSRIETWEALKKILGRSPSIHDLTDGSFRAAIERAMYENGVIYTNAFILCAADAYGQGRKYRNHIELFKDMFINRQFAQNVLAASSLKSIYELLHTFPLIGNFMAYQIAIDLNYSPYVNFSENEFTVAGPGALRGIKKVFENTNNMTPEEIIFWMVEHQDEEFKKCGYDFRGLFGRKLTAVDCQGLFCETDKYCREATPELVSGRSRIKAKFKQQSDPFVLFFPPKWSLEY